MPLEPLSLQSNFPRRVQMPLFTVLISVLLTSLSSVRSANDDGLRETISWITSPVTNMAVWSRSVTRVEFCHRPKTRLTAQPSSYSRLPYQVELRLDFLDRAGTDESMDSDLISTGTQSLTVYTWKKRQMVDISFQPLSGEPPMRDYIFMFPEKHYFPGPGVSYDVELQEDTRPGAKAYSFCFYAFFELPRVVRNRRAKYTVLVGGKNIESSKEFCLMPAGAYSEDILTNEQCVTDDRPILKEVSSRSQFASSSSEYRHSGSHPIVSHMSSQENEYKMEVSLQQGHLDSTASGRLVWTARSRAKVVIHVAFTHLADPTDAFVEIKLRSSPMQEMGEMRRIGDFLIPVVPPTDQTVQSKKGRISIPKCANVIGVPRVEMIQDNRYFLKLEYEFQVHPKWFKDKHFVVKTAVQDIRDNVITKKSMKILENELEVESTTMDSTLLEIKGYLREQFSSARPSHSQDRRIFKERHIRIALELQKLHAVTRTYGGPTFQELLECPMDLIDATVCLVRYDNDRVSDVNMPCDTVPFYRSNEHLVALVAPSVPKGKYFYRIMIEVEGHTFGFVTDSFFLETYYPSSPQIGSSAIQNFWSLLSNRFSSS